MTTLIKQTPSKIFNHYFVYYFLLQFSQRKQKDLNRNYSYEQKTVDFVQPQHFLPLNILLEQKQRRVEYKITFIYKCEIIRRTLNMSLS